MIIRAVRLRAATSEGDFGFNFLFSRKLTVIRANNSSGKSTLFNSILCALGMEELVGGKGNRALPYAVKDYFEFEDATVKIAASEVFIEIENRSDHVVTLRRAIIDDVRDTRLIEVFQGAYLTESTPLSDPSPTYLHDPGGAQKKEGFHHFLERFLDLSLPQVPSTSGAETKLYLQTIFAAVAVEQKRGWTDYIANVPFFGIRDAKTRVAEFLLGLSVFETNAERNRLNNEAVAIDQEWKAVAEELRRTAASSGAIIEGLSNQPSALFNPSEVQVKKRASDALLPLPDYIAVLRNEHKTLAGKSADFSQSAGATAVREIEAVTEELRRLSVVHERASASLTLQRSSLLEYEQLHKDASEDLERNKTAQKLRELGAQNAVDIASGVCPTCHQPVEDNLLREAVTGPQMDISTNIRYLESQSRMLQRQIVGVKENVKRSEHAVQNLGKQMSAKQDQLHALRGDVTSGATESKAIVRRQVEIEVEIAAIQKSIDTATDFLARLVTISARLKENQLARKKLPKDAYTSDDLERIGLFQKNFRANAGSFGYESAPIAEIEINTDNLTPCLAQLELREILRKEIRNDSSASDFVRLIWSYLLALYQTSSHASYPGNHPGVLLFDEPGQHSMAADSQHALFQQLASERSLQTIVAASFDELDYLFEEATEGVEYSLIRWEGKLIRPL